LYTSKTGTSKTRKVSFEIGHFLVAQVEFAAGMWIIAAKIRIQNTTG